MAEDIKLLGTMGGNTTPTGTNIAYVDVEEIFPYVEFDRRINPKIETDIDLIKQTILDKGYMYDTGQNSGVVFSMYVDSRGNIMIGEGNHRIRALYEVAQETGQKIYIPINLNPTSLDNVAEATKITDSYKVRNELNKLFKEFEEILGLQKGDTANWIITTGNKEGRIAQKAVSNLTPGNDGLPQSSISRFLNAIGINAITYDELPDNSIYKTGVNTFIDTPTNVVDDIPVGGVREEPFFNFGNNIDIPLQINEQGNVILYRTTDNPDYLQVSDFTQKNTRDIGSLGFGQHSYFGPNIETPQAFWVASTNRGLYKYDTNIKPSEIFIGNIGDKPDLAKALGIPEQYWNMNYHRFLIETKDTYRKVLTDNIELFKQYGIKALGRYGGTSGPKSFEIIPLITNEDNLGVKAVAELEPIKGIGKGGAANWKVKEVITDTPTTIAGAEVIDDIEGIQRETLEKLRNANDAFVAEQIDDIMARKINEVLPFVDTSLSRAEAIGISTTGPQITTSADPVLNTFIDDIEKITGQSMDIRDKRKLRQFIYDTVTNNEYGLLNDAKSFSKDITVNASKLNDPGYKVWKNWQNSGAFRPNFKPLRDRTLTELIVFDPPPFVSLVNGLEVSGESINFTAISDADVNIPNNLADNWVDNLGRTTTSFVDNLPLETVVKNRVKSLVARKTKQLAKPGSLLVKAIDAWEFGVIGLMAAGVAFNEIDEVPTIINNTAINMFNSMTAPYGIAPVKKEEYDIDYEFINTVLDTGSKVMPTDIIIEKLKPYSLEEGEDVILPGTGVTATTGAKQQFEPYGEELAERAEKTVNIKRDEVKQDLLESKGVQEEKMFEQAKPKKSKATGGAGAKIL